MTTWMNSLSYGSRSLGDEYKHAEDYPDRYTYYFASAASDASHLVFIITFHHINRRHALSPDGWGMMRTERIFYVGTEEAESKEESGMNNMPKITSMSSKMPRAMSRQLIEVIAVVQMP